MANVARRQVVKPTNRSKGGFFIEVGCPGCGAELELQENFFVITCTHCGSCLRVVMPDVPVAYLVKGELPGNEIRFRIDRLLKDRKLPLTGSDLQVKSLYYPFWKIDAMVVKVRNRIQRREIRPPSEYSDGQYMERETSDIGVSPYTISVAAGSRMDGIPASLGMRSEYIRMYPYSKEAIQESFDTLPVVRSPEDVQTNVVMNLISLGESDINAVGINKTELFHPKFSLVFFPYYIVESYDGGGYGRYLLDGVSGRVLHFRHPLDKGDKSAQEPINADGFSDMRMSEGWEGSVFDAFPDSVWDDLTRADNDEETEIAASCPVEFGALGVEFHRCPTCGQDLPGRQSHMYICRNCQEPVMLERPPFPLEGIWRTTIDEHRGDRLFPFWSFKISGARSPMMRRLFGGIFNSDRLVIPAFRMPNFEAMYRLAKRMSAASPKLDMVTVDAVDKHFVPVDVGMSNALTMADLVIYREMLNRDQNSSPREEAFAPEEVSLVFASFHPQSYFYVDSLLGAVTFEKTGVG